MHTGYSDAYAAAIEANPRIVSARVTVFGGNKLDTPLVLNTEELPTGFTFTKTATGSPFEFGGVNIGTAEFQIDTAEFLRHNHNENSKRLLLDRVQEGARVLLEQGFVTGTDEDGADVAELYPIGYFYIDSIDRGSGSELYLHNERTHTVWSVGCVDLMAYLEDYEASDLGINFNTTTSGITGKIRDAMGVLFGWGYGQVFTIGQFDCTQYTARDLVHYLADHVSGFSYVNDEDRIRIVRYKTQDDITIPTTGMPAAFARYVEKDQCLSANCTRLPKIEYVKYTGEGGAVFNKKGASEASTNVVREGNALVDAITTSASKSTAISNILNSTVKVLDGSSTFDWYEETEIEMEGVTSTFQYPHHCSFVYGEVTLPADPRLEIGDLLVVSTYSSDDIANDDWILQICEIEYDAYGMMTVRRPNIDQGRKYNPNIKAAAAAANVSNAPAASAGSMSLSGGGTGDMKQEAVQVSGLDIANLATDAAHKTEAAPLSLTREQLARVLFNCIRGHSLGFFDEAIGKALEGGGDGLQ